MSSIRKKLEGKTTKLATLNQRLQEQPPTEFDEYQEGSFFNVEVALIQPNPHQPRKYFDPDALEELSSSIKDKGILQPVIISKDGNQIYLVAGERRLRAAKMAGLEKIPAIITKGNPAEIALIENLQREDLKPIEEAEALGRMIDEYNYTHEQLSLVIGKARSTITESLSLNKLPEQIKEECRRANNLPRRLLVEITKAETPEAMFSLFNRIKENNLNSGQVREITRKRVKSNPRHQEEIAVEKIADLANYLKKLDFSAINEPHRSSLLDGLKNLKTLIEEIAR